MIPRFVGGSQGKVSQNVLTRGRGYGMMGTSQMVTKSWNAQPDGRPGGPRKPREAPEASEGPGKARKPRKPRKPRKGPGGPRAAKDPARKPERPCRAVCPEGGRPAEGRRRDCRCTACGGQASPLFPTPPQAGCGQGGGCGLAPVQGRLSASLKQVPGCLKGRCPATWVHERAEIAPNRAQRQRPAASGRSRGDCPRCRVKIQPQGAFFGA